MKMNSRSKPHSLRELSLLPGPESSHPHQVRKISLSRAMWKTGAVNYSGPMEQSLQNSVQPVPAAFGKLGQSLPSLAGVTSPGSPDALSRADTGSTEPTKGPSSTHHHSRSNSTASKLKRERENDAADGGQRPRVYISENGQDTPTENIDPHARSRSGQQGSMGRATSRTEDGARFVQQRTSTLPPLPFAPADRRLLLPAKSGNKKVHRGASRKRCSSARLEESVAHAVA